MEIFWFCTCGLHVDLCTWNTGGFGHVKTIWKCHLVCTWNTCVHDHIHMYYIWYTRGKAIWRHRSKECSWIWSGFVHIKTIWKMPSGIHVEYMCTWPYGFCHMYTICIQLEKTWKSYGIQMYTTWFRRRITHVCHMVLYTWNPDGTICIPHVFHMILPPGDRQKDNLILC